MDLFLDDRNVDLIEFGIDVALRMGDLADSGLTARKLGQARRLLIGTPSYFEKAGEPKAPMDLMSHQAVVYDRKGGGATWTFRRESAEVSVTVQGRVRINAAEGIREAVLSGIGLTIASEWMFDPELKDGRVRAAMDDWHLPPRPVGRISDWASGQCEGSGLYIVHREPTSL